MTFTADDWSTPRTVTVTGVDDDASNLGGARTTAFVHAVTGADYAGVGAPSIAVTVTGDDVPGLTVSTTTLDVAEAGGTRTYTVRLNTWPSADVTVRTDQPTPSRRTRPDGTEKVREIERRRPGPTKRLPPPRRNGTAVIDGATLRCAII